MANLLRRALTAVFLLTNICAAHASFVFETNSPANARPQIVDSSPIVNLAPSIDAKSAGTVRWKMAYGFGNAVPLSFACRQIVPPAVKVTYGQGVNPATLVTWKGGDSWNRILRDTVKPLGMYLQMTYMAVEIDKQTSP